MPRFPEETASASHPDGHRVFCGGSRIRQDEKPILNQWPPINGEAPYGYSVAASAARYSRAIFLERQTEPFGTFRKIYHSRDLGLRLFPGLINCSNLSGMFVVVQIGKFLILKGSVAASPHAVAVKSFGGDDGLT